MPQLKNCLAEREFIPLPQWSVWGLPTLGRSICITVHPFRCWLLQEMPSQACPEVTFDQMSGVDPPQWEKSGPQEAVWRQWSKFNTLRSDLKWLQVTNLLTLLKETWKS